jgi:hypothetical protein
MKLTHNQKGWLLTILIIVVVLLTVWGSLSHAHAGELDAWEFRFFGINAKDFKDRNPVVVVVGGLASFAVHEAGHYVAAELTGMDASFDWGERAVWADNYSDKSNDQKALFHAGGFLATAIVGTALTAIPVTRYSDFNVGFTGWTAIHDVGYALTDGTREDDISDTQNLDRYGYNGQAIAAFTGLYSGVLSYYNINKVKEDAYDGNLPDLQSSISNRN